MKIYISGAITRNPTYKEDFERAERWLRELFGKSTEEIEIINPVKLVSEEEEKRGWEVCMRRCIKALCDCDVIYMIGNWRASAGARLENHIACMLRISTLYEKGWNEE